MEVLERSIKVMQKIADGLDRPPRPINVPFPPPPDIDAEFITSNKPSRDARGYTPDEEGVYRPNTPGEAVKDSPTISHFEHDLAGLINKYSLENETNIPDFIMANYLVRCMEALRYTVVKTHNLYEGTDGWKNPIRNSPSTRKD